MKNKKKIALALFLATSIYSSAFAAVTDTFNDVPADHWAYKAVERLQQDGIIDGVDSKTFQGNKTVSRYEMAQVVEKAMNHSDKATAKQKALIDKLAAEFALELNNIDIRVKKVENFTASTLKIGMDTTTLFGSDHPGGNNPAVKGNEKFIWRMRLWLSGDLNEKTKFNARIGTGLYNPGASFGSTAQNNTIASDRAYLTFSDVLGVDSIRLGRMGINELGGNIMQRTGSDDGIQINKSLSKNTNVHFGAFVGKQQPAAVGNFVGDSQDLQFISLNSKLDKNLSVGAMYANNHITVSPSSTTVGYSGSRIKGLSSVYKMGGITFLGEYDWVSLSNTSANAPTKTPRAYALQLTTGKVANTSFFLVPQTLCDMNKPGDSAFTVAYHYLGAGSVPAGHSPWRNLIATSSLNTNAGGSAFVDNAKGWAIDYQYVLLKNVEIDFLYQSLKYANKVGAIAGGSKLNDTFSVTINTVF